MHLCGWLFSVRTPVCVCECVVTFALNSALRVCVLLVFISHGNFVDYTHLVSHSIHPGAVALATYSIATVYDGHK